MSVTNPDFSRFLAYGRPILLGFLLYVVIGYALYFVALAQPEPPAWAIDYIEQLKPTIKALDTASQISDRPFPAQLMIFYVTIGTVLLTIYVIFCAFFVKHIRRELYRRQCERIQEVGEAFFSRSTDVGRRDPMSEQATGTKVSPKLRLKLAAMGIFLTIVSLVPFPMVLTTRDSTNISWRAVAFFSPNFSSVTCLLVASSSVALGCLCGLGYLCLSVSSLQCREQTRS